MPAQPWGGPPAPGAVPLASLEHVVTKPSRKGRMAAAGIGAIALVGGGVFAATQFAGGQGGAATPEAAVDEFVGAINGEDVLGVLNALPKGERDTFVPVAQESLEELKRLGILADDADLAKIAGLDIEISGYGLEVEEVADTVANVTLSGGSVRGGYQLAELPLGSFIVDNVFDGQVPGDGASVSEDNEESITLTTVKDGGGWHVSLWYSVAENAREAAGLPAPAFGNGVEAVGADSPEAAVEEFVGAIGDLDVRRMIALTPPDEMAALHDYAPLFLDDAEDAIAELKDTYGIELSITPTDLGVTGDGDRRLVSVGGFTAEGSVDGQDFELTVDGDCVSYDVAGERDELCTADALEQAGADLPESLTTFLDALAAQPQGIRVVQVDGEWFVSPIGTAGDGLLSVLRSLDADLLQDLVADGGDIMETAGSSAAGFGSGFPFGSVDLNDGFVVPSEDDTYSDTDEDDDTSADTDDPSSDGDAGYEAYSKACGEFESLDYGAETAEEWQLAVELGSACALPFLQRGDIDEYDVPTEFARPECYTAWPWDPALTLAEQDAVFDAVDACTATPSKDF